LRKRKGLTQRNVAEHLKMSVQYYSLIERGERQESLSVDLLCSFSQLFDVSTQELIFKERMYSIERDL